MADSSVFTSVNTKDLSFNCICVNALLPAGKATMNNGEIISSSPFSREHLSMLIQTQYQLGLAQLSFVNEILDLGKLSREFRNIISDNML